MYGSTISACADRLEKERLDSHLECEDLLLALEQAEKNRVTQEIQLQHA